MISSVGRAPRLHRDCQRFESVITHLKNFLVFEKNYLGCQEGEIAQLVRVLACHAKGRGFDPRFSREYSNKSK